MIMKSTSNFTFYDKTMVDVHIFFDKINISLHKMQGSLFWFPVQ